MFGAGDRGRAGSWRAKGGSRFPLGGVHRDSDDLDGSFHGEWRGRAPDRGRGYQERGRGGGRGRGEGRGGGRSQGPPRPTSENDGSWRFLYAVTRPNARGLRDSRGVDRFLEVRYLSVMNNVSDCLSKCLVS